MGLFDRMGKAISANVNSLLDGAENDAKLVNLTLEEMGEELKRARSEVVSAVASEKTLRKKVENLTEERDRWEKRAELALRGDDEQLAREALKHKQKTAAEVDAAEKARVESRDHALKMKKELERMEAKYEELKMRKGTIVARAEQARAGASEESTGGGGGAFASFRAMEEKIEGREAEGLAMREVEEALGTGEKRDLEARFRDLEAGLTKSSGATAVDDELASLKKRIKL
jgi:phage shock protein A